MRSTHPQPTRSRNGRLDSWFRDTPNTSLRDQARQLMIVVNGMRPAVIAHMKTSQTKGKSIIRAKRRTKAIDHTAITLTQTQRDELVDMQNALMDRAFKTEALIARLTRSTRKNKHELIAEAARRQAGHTIAYADGIGALLEMAEEDLAALIASHPRRPAATVPESTLVH